MKRNSPRADWLFPIVEASLLVTVTHKGVARDVRVPHKKALIAARREARAFAATAPPSNVVPGLAPGSTALSFEAATKPKCLKLPPHLSEVDAFHLCLRRFECVWSLLA